jgi:AcrR family transcriptional regulator
MKPAERRQQLRDALIAAAEERIAADGLSGLKARDLARDVGCALGAIYNVFPDLDALILEVNARTLAGFATFIAEKKAGSEDGPIEALTRLATRYLEFAVANQRRWRALFQHRMTDGRPVPDWYREAQTALFVEIEAPLREICPDRAEEERRLLARSLFSAVHGIVSLGLDEKLAAVPLERLREQLREIVTALGRGLSTA